MLSVQGCQQAEDVIYFLTRTALAISRRIGGRKEGLQENLLEQYFSNCRSRLNIRGMKHQLGILTSIF